MKCLLCNFESNKTNEIKIHYIDFHNANKNNQFFINLLKKTNNIFCGGKCLRCDEFLPSTWFKVVHNLLVHYDGSKNVFEEKPLVYTNIGEIQKYSITLSEHSTYYDFYNSDKSVDDFLWNFKNCVKRSSQGELL